MAGLMLKSFMLGFWLACVSLGQEKIGPAAPPPGIYFPTNPSNQSDTVPFSFVHYHLNTTSAKAPAIQPYESRPMEHCTTPHMRGWTFSSSHCDYHRSLQSLQVVCHKPNDAQNYKEELQSCSKNEICVDTGRSIAKSKAYCVSPQMRNSEYFPYSYRAVKAITIPNPAGASTISANALVSDNSRSERLWANDLRLEAIEQQAEAASREFGADVVIGTRHCEGCFSLRLQPLPDGTAALKATIVIENTEPGYLFLVTVS